VNLANGLGASVVRAARRGALDGSGDGHDEILVAGPGRHLQPDG
jgi:hypothetical protein